jgi:hypothetical protein
MIRAAALVPLRWCRQGVTLMLLQIRCNLFQRRGKCDRKRGRANATFLRTPLYGGSALEGLVKRIDLGVPEADIRECLLRGQKPTLERKNSTTKGIISRHFDSTSTRRPSSACHTTSQNPHADAHR